MPPASALHPLSRQALPAPLPLTSISYFLSFYQFLRLCISSLCHPMLVFFRTTICHLILLLNCASLLSSKLLTITFIFPVSSSLCLFFLSNSFFSPVLLHFSLLFCFPLSLLSSAGCYSFPHQPLPEPCQPMPAAQGTLSPPLPTAEVSDMGTDVAVVPCGAGGCGMQVCIICECVCIFINVSVCFVLCVCVYCSSRLDQCLSVFFCQMASANTLAAWWAVVCLRVEARSMHARMCVCVCVCVCVRAHFAASCGE